MNLAVFAIVCARTVASQLAFLVIGARDIPPGFIDAAD